MRTCMCSTSSYDALTCTVSCRCTLAGLVSSEKYLQEHRRQLAEVRSKRGAKSRKKKKKHRRGRGEPASESDDDVPVIHHVTTVVDAPEVEH